MWKKSRIYFFVFMSVFLTNVPFGFCDGEVQKSDGFVGWFHKTFFPANHPAISLDERAVRDAMLKNHGKLANDLSDFFWTTKAPESRFAQGKKLYNSNCMQCHGPLEQADIRGKSATDISTAFSEVKKMAKFKNKFVGNEVELIAESLNAPSGGEPANAKKTPADQRANLENPQVYALARKYFPADEVVSSSKRIFRLTRSQLDATVISLLPKYYVSSISKAMARDPMQTNYEFADILNFNSSNFWQLSLWIHDIAERVKKDPTGVVDCKASGFAADCLSDRAKKFIVRAFRGRVNEEQSQKYLRFYLDSVSTAGVGEATGDFVEAVLSSPGFLFRSEVGTNARETMLTQAEYLANLTYTLADFPPESLGLSSATPASYVKSAEAVKLTVDSILSSSASRRKLAKFFSAWLEIRDPEDFKISTSTYPSFNLDLAQAMVEESEKFLQYNLSKPNPKLKDITKATQSFVSQKLEKIYETGSKNLTGNDLVSLDPTKRLGIFSQPAVIASHSGPTSTRLIKRGVFWVRKVMCMDLEAPPAGLDNSIPPSDTTTERRRVESGTSQNACMGCHKIINPFGFFQENMDALGKWRNQDNSFPVESNINVDFLDEGSLSSSSYVDALKAFTNSSRFKQCFVRQLFRYYLGRVEEESDHPVLREMFYAFTQNNDQDIVSLLRVLSNSDRFVRRSE